MFVTFELIECRVKCVAAGLNACSTSACGIYWFDLNSRDLNSSATLCSGPTGAPLAAFLVAPSSNGMCSRLPQGRVRPRANLPSPTASAAAERSSPISVLEEHVPVMAQSMAMPEVVMAVPEVAAIAEEESIEVTMAPQRVAIFDEQSSRPEPVAACADEENVHSTDSVPSDRHGGKLL